MERILGKRASGQYKRCDNIARVPREHSSSDIELFTWSGTFFPCEINSIDASLLEVPVLGSEVDMSSIRHREKSLWKGFTKL